ncbi:MAG: c-type cytochrome [Pseudomonadota bacterium]
MAIPTRNRFAVRTFAAVVCGTAGIALSATVTSAEATGWSAAMGDATRGEARATELYCNVCHGPAGNSVTPQWPVLAGQHAGYLAEQLSLFRPRERTNIEMAPLAAMLTDADILDLAAYYAAQTPTPTSAPPPGAGEAGEMAAAKLYAEGEVARGIAACASCHGKTGGGDPAQRTPALHGQQAIYAIKQLKDYAARARYTKNGALAEQMSVLAAKLSVEEMNGLGNWLQSLR